MKVSKKDQFVFGQLNFDQLSPTTATVELKETDFGFSYFYNIEGTEQELNMIAEFSHQLSALVDPTVEYDIEHENIKVWKEKNPEAAQALIGKYVAIKDDMLIDHNISLFKLMERIKKLKDFNKVYVSYLDNID